MVFSWRFRLPFLSSFTLCLLVFSFAYGEEALLKTETKGPVVDGDVQNGEYSFSYELQEMILHLNRSTRKFNAALEAQTEGWVGIGFNSSVMNDAEILLGYFSDGKASYREQVGKGRRHKDKELPWVKTVALSESGGKTTLEIELDPEGVIDPGGDTVSIIIAFGEEDSFNSYHKRRKGVTVQLKE